ncbi:hypothetical protein GG804_18625 [Sphingomonas histidinilytica]|uniref:hypothetical protein n=1 Tax=Sphingomonadales TaxID=204457 RepID=UPI00076FFF53|nr:MULTISPECIES: hypothetical protein [Sphingomonadaceae]AMK23056.1 hypothetical protein K426_10570 [Sphingobium sp. TKS]MBO9378786.1 hypothetical protein [Rhizorhabdus histidinilytica]MCF8707831.1 hypothetical protein [Rhizorhapis sp. SPR117]
MKPFDPVRPEPPRREDGKAFGILATILMAVTWLGLYGLVKADIISEQALPIVIIVAAPVATFVIMGFEWAATSTSAPKAFREVPPPADFTALWPLDHGRSDAAQSPRTRKRNATRHPGVEPGDEP